MRKRTEVSGGMPRRDSVWAPADILDAFAILTVDESVAIVVQSVLADLGTGARDARVHVGPGVVAVVGVRDHARGGRAGLDRRGGVSEAVPVGVGIEGEEDVFVDDTVTVVVDAVADLQGAGIHVGPGVVAVVP